jgi:hypothetical protein
MAVPDHEVFPPTLRVAEDADVSNWLEALSARECTPDEFLAEILRREKEEPDVGWEALALLDQEFRHQGISREVYTNLKTRIHQHFVAAPDVPPPEPPVAPVYVPSPIVATREVSLVDIPVISTATDVAPTSPVENPIHGQLRVGDRLGDRYRVVEILRKSSTGMLVEAIDEQKIELPGVRKRVAIQVVNETLSRDREYLHRIGTLQCLSHPAIARLFDVEEHEGALLLVMELLNGPSLFDMLARTGSSKPHLSVAQSALSSVASALAYAHSQRVAHGDVTSKNIFITQAGDFRLQGFELQGAHPPDATADRRAFARLAYQVLAGSAAVDPQMERLPLMRPHGIGRNQWRAIRRTLNRKGGTHDVLAAFAGDAPPKASKGWGAAAILTAALGLGIGGYLYANAKLSSPSAAPAIAESKPVAAPPPLPATPAPVATVATVIAAPPARPRIDLPVRFASVPTTAPVARIWVRRRDNLDGAVTFKWWTESGSAEVDRDFRRIEPRTETIPAGATGLEVLVPLMPDPERVESRTFWVKIDETSRGARLGESTLMQVAIVPAGT